MLPDASESEIKDRLYAELKRTGRIAMNGAEPPEVVLAFPGPVTPQGHALAAPHIWGERFTDPIDLAGDLKKIWPGAKVSVINDVTAAGYRYLRCAQEDLCIVTVSSSIGGKVFVDGRPIVGPNGRGGEFGHIRLDNSEDAPLCECGGQGHLAALASGSASLYQARKLAAENESDFRSSGLGEHLGGKLDHLDNRTIIEFVQSNDPWTHRLIYKMAEPLGRLFATLHLTIGVERFVIVGGFALAVGETYRNAIATVAESACWNLAQDWNSMVELGIADDNSGLIGCGRYASLTS
jgi:glucokinase